MKAIIVMNHFEITHSMFNSHTSQIPRNVEGEKGVTVLGLYQYNAIFVFQWAAF